MKREENMVKVIVNSDDFGYSRGINFGIMDCYKRGVLTSGTLMTNMPGFEHAVELAKENPGFGVGIHMVLTAQGPVLDTHKIIADPETGMFRKQKEYKEEINQNIYTLLDYKEQMIAENNTGE